MAKRSFAMAMATYEGARTRLAVRLKHAAPEAKKQWENEKEHMQKRLAHIDQELETEPREIEALYQVSLKRL